jgi:acyl-coenzyme A thioesterase PaaI-like protein
VSSDEAAVTSDEAAVSVAVAVRGLMDAVVLTDADDATLLEVATQVSALTELLSTGLRTEMLWGDTEGMMRGLRPFSPVIGPANPAAPPMLVRMCEDGSVVGEVTMRAIHEGPPGAVHGGWVAALLDQLLGHANAAVGVGGMTAELTVRYRRPTPYGVPLEVRARSDRVDGRRVEASGEVVADGIVTASAKGLFLRPSPERIAEMGQALVGRLEPSGGE